MKKASKQKICELDRIKKFALALAICERMLPNYAMFESEVGWGNYKVLSSMVFTLWDLILGVTNVDENILKDKLAECELIIPDVDSFKSILTSSAFDTSNAVCILLENYNNGCEIKTVLEISQLAIDSIDMYIQFTDLSGNSTIGSNEEHFIKRHPLMLQELQRLDYDVNFLTESHDEVLDLISSFRNIVVKREGIFTLPGTPEPEPRRVGNVFLPTMILTLRWAKSLPTLLD